MKAGWPIKTLDEVCQFRGGGTPSKAVGRYWKGEIPWVSPKDMKFDVVSDSIDHISQEAIQSSATSLIPKDSVLMVVRSGILARIVPLAITGRDLTINQDLKALCPNGAVDARFLYHLLESKMDLLLSMVSRGATVHRLMTDQIRSIEFGLPPLPEQQRIVGILDEAFDGIATAKANAERNLQNARALFESHLQSVFTQRSEGWVEKTLEEVCIIGDGNHSSNYPKKEELVELGVPFIRATNLVAGRISGEDMRFLSPEKHAQLKKGHLKTGDVLITNRGEIGKTAIVDADYNNSNLNSQIAWLRCRDGLDNRFLFHVLNSGDIQSHFQISKSGAALQQFTIKQLKALKVPMPPKSIQQMIVGKLDLLDEETQRLESIYQQKLAALDELKKSLLHQAFTGQL